MPAGWALLRSLRPPSDASSASLARLDLLLGLAELMPDSWSSAMASRLWPVLPGDVSFTWPAQPLHERLVIPVLCQTVIRTSAQAGRSQAHGIRTGCCH